MADLAGLIERCRSCGAPVVWVKTARGLQMPVNADTYRAGDAGMHMPDHQVSHFATCPQAKQWRKDRKANAAVPRNGVPD